MPCLQIMLALVMTWEKTAGRVVLAYSGGLDTSVILHWLKAGHAEEVVAFCANLGQEEDFEAVRTKALATGASECVIGDLREEFVRDYCYPMLRAGAVYEGEYLLGTSIARPVIAKAMLDVARGCGAEAIAHGATGKGNDQVRFELTALGIDPGIRIIAPWREWGLRSRTDCIEYARQHGIAVSASAEKPYSIDDNLFHTSYEGGMLEDPWREPHAEMFLMTCDPVQAPDEPDYITLRYARGDAVALNDREMSPAQLLASLNQLGGRHGVGRADIVENRFVGMKSRGVYETPGGTILHKAHRAVESLTMHREVMRLRDQLVPEYAALVYRGLWFSPERLALQALVDEGQREVTGEARLRLYKGGVQVVGRRSPVSLYNPEVATFDHDEAYVQSDATGFIRLNALRLRLRALRDAAAFPSK